MCSFSWCSCCHPSTESFQGCSFHWWTPRKNRSLACFTSIILLFPSMGREFQGILLLTALCRKGKKIFGTWKGKVTMGDFFFLLMFRILCSPTYYFCGSRSLMRVCGTEFKFPPEIPHLHWRRKHSPPLPHPTSHCRSQVYWLSIAV